MSASPKCLKSTYNWVQFLQFCLSADSHDEARIRQACSPPFPHLTICCLFLIFDSVVSFWLGSFLRRQNNFCWVLGTPLPPDGDVLGRRSEPLLNWAFSTDLQLLLLKCKVIRWVILPLVWLRRFMVHFACHFSVMISPWRRVSDRIQADWRLLWVKWIFYSFSINPYLSVSHPQIFPEGTLMR